MFLIDAIPDAGTGLLLGLGLEKDDGTGGSHARRPGRLLPACQVKHEETNLQTRLELHTLFNDARALVNF